MGQFVSSKNLLQSHSPLVVGAVSRAGTLASLSNMPSLSDEWEVAELRLDFLQMAGLEIHGILRSVAVPIPFTARSPGEGGDGHLSVAQRTALLESHLDVAALMDVELRSAMELQGVIAKAKARGVGVIGSSHDFNSTPG